MASYASNPLILETTPELSTGSTTQEESISSSNTDRAKPGSGNKQKEGKLVQRLLKKMQPKKKQNIDTIAASTTPSSASSNDAVAVPLSEVPIQELGMNAVEEEAQKAKDHASFLQKQATVYRRTVWDHHDKDQLERCIASLKDEIWQLDKILALKSPTNAASSLPPNQKKFHNPKIQTGLQTLHESLKALESTPKESRKTRLGVYIADSPIENWKTLKEDSCYVPSASDKEGLVFCIQMPDDDEAATQVASTAQGGLNSTLILVELEYAPANKSEEVPPRELRNWDDISNHDDSVDNLDSYAALGIIPRSKNASTLHRVYRDRTIWTRKCSLADWMSDETFRRELHISHVIQLAFTVVQAYLDFTFVRPSCSPIRLQSLEYYRRQNDIADVDDTHNPMLLPYLSTGFGQRTSRRTLGATRTLRSTYDSGMIELGILLFQVGGRQVLSFEATAAIADPVLAARETARNGLRAVERHSTPRFAEIVRILLDYQNADVGKETETMECILNALAELEHDLSKSVF